MVQAQRIIISRGSCARSTHFYGVGPSLTGQWWIQLAVFYGDFEVDLERLNPIRMKVPLLIILLGVGLRSTVAYDE